MRKHEHFRSHLRRTSDLIDHYLRPSKCSLPPRLRTQAEVKDTLCTAYPAAASDTITYDRITRAERTVSGLIRRECEYPPPFSYKTEETSQTLPHGGYIGISLR